MGTFGDRLTHVTEKLKHGYEHYDGVANGQYILTLL